MIPQQLDQKMQFASPFLVELKKLVADTLSPFADKYNYPFSGRIKRLKSIAEKIEMGRFECFSEIDDLVAFTLIVPSATHEKNVINFCKLAFDVIAVRDKSDAQKPPETFRFDSTRVIARARRPPHLEKHVGPSIFEYAFELQVRTAFEHAWSVATHDLVYKGSVVDWKRMRLAAQLKATSEGLDAAIAAFDHLASGITESPWARLSDQIHVAEFVRSIFENKRLPDALIPDSVSRFSENFCTLVRSIEPSMTVSNSIDVIDNALQITSPIPISLSLYQLFLGLLCQSGRVVDARRTPCHITAELTTLFPETKKLTRIFDYNA